MEEPKLSQSELRQIINYNPLTGEFKWKTRPSVFFVEEHVATRWNSRWANEPAGTWCKSIGYLRIKILGTLYLAHRLAYLYMEGVIPDDVVDHKDRDRTNNKWENLQPVTYKVNAMNRSLNSNSSSKVNGVSFHKKAKKWRAYATLDSKQIHIGYFEDKELAEEARLAFNDDNGFTTGHGQLNPTQLSL